MAVKDYICPVCGCTKQPMDDKDIEIIALKQENEQLTKENVSIRDDYHKLLAEYLEKICKE